MRLHYEEALSSISQTLLDGPALEQRGLRGTLEQMADACRVQWTALFVSPRNAPAQESLHLMEQAFSMPEGSPQEPSFHLDRLPFDKGLQRWRQFLSQGDVVGGVVDSLPEGERKELRHLDLASVLALPIHIEQQWRGALVLGDKQRPRSWGKEDLRFLKTCAQMISAFLGRSEARLELLEAKRKAEEANENKTKFMAVVSHEIRRPMNVILNLSRLTLETQLNDLQRDYLETILNSARQSLEVLGDLLNISKVEAGKFKLTQTDFHLGDLVESTVRAMRTQAANKGIRLEYQIGDRVPVHLKGDPARVRQVLANILSNALKFTEHGSIEVHVKPAGAPQVSDKSQAQEKLWVSFIVRDSGSGIPPEELDTIFETFHSSVHDSELGSGLGLAICKQLVEAMGGRINVQSRPGNGATFSFILPFEPGDPAEAATEQEKTGLLAPQWDLGRSLNILLAEDDPSSAKVANIYFESLGHRSETVYNGLEALRALKKGSFELVIMDIEMPRMNGFETVRRIRSGESGEGNRQIPIIALSAHSGEEWRERCLQGGMQGFLSKPYDLEQLASSIYKVLKGREGVWKRKQHAPEVPRQTLNREWGLRRVNNNEEQLERLYRVFSETIRETEKRLRNAREEGAWDRLKKEAHSLKGAAGIVGAEICFHLAEQLEAAVSGDDPENIRTLCDRLLEELTQVHALIG